MQYVKYFHTFVHGIYTFKHLFIFEEKVDQMILLHNLIRISVLVCKIRNKQKQKQISSIYMQQTNFDYELNIDWLLKIRIVKNNLIKQLLNQSLSISHQYQNEVSNHVFPCGCFLHVVSSILFSSHPKSSSASRTCLSTSSQGSL